MIDYGSPSEREIAVAYLDAIRLANVGAANDEAFRRVVTNMLDFAPGTSHPDIDTLSTRFLVDAIQRSQGELTVA